MRSALAGVSGVDNVVHVDVASATVQADSSVTTKQLSNALKEAGFGVSSIELVEAPDRESTEENRDRKGATNKPPSLPSINARTLDGTTFNAKDLKGKVVLVDFWGTWCPPCVKEATHLQELHEKWKDDGLVILGIAVGDTEKAVKKFRKNNQLTYPMVVETESIQKTFREALGPFGGIPTKYLFDRNGKLKHASTGYQEPDELESVLAPLLGEQPPGTKTADEAGAESDGDEQHQKGVTATFKVANLVERKDKL